MIIVCVTMFYISPFSYGQLKLKNDFVKSNVDLYSWFDKEIGLEKTVIYNGFLDDGDGYFEKNRSFENTNRYYKQFEFFNGSIVYDRQLFNNVKIKYDVFEDELLINLKNSNNNLITIQPINNKVDSFMLNSQYFVNIDNLTVEQGSYNGYVELLLNNENFQFYKKHIKSRIEKRSNNKLLYQFSDRNYNLLHYNKSLIKIKKIRNLSKIFPEYKSVIRKYSVNYKSNDSNIIDLLKKINLLMNKKTKAL
ncbi:hypothetical protein AX016_2763 [Cellulophaga sp. RHA19]|uniref:hypothetical protein n=2 Tax=unclassified Cellulophaga TaxID=2634405 RepID=UPI000CBFCA25|nr:hypothetical protein [Cellulophaga sp. RHA19]PKB44543.1 hypothetical protein AX016_2763 [Cellulophaga sp. RHA19]